MAKTPRKNKTVEPDLSTEEKILEAARVVFMKKGYAATRTRDIAEEAGMNLALLNYYFRSKEKLFEKVMTEKVQKLFGVIAPLLMDDSTDFEQKVERIVATYIDMLIMNPDLPIFVLSEIRNNPERFSSMIQAGSLLTNSAFIRQLTERLPNVNPLHFLINIIAMTIFPFVARPVVQAAGIIDQKAFEGFINQRKKLIPVWIKAMMECS
jgi:AcrR family transcriptional regulator